MLFTADHDEVRRSPSTRWNRRLFAGAFIRQGNQWGAFCCPAPPEPRSKSTAYSPRGLLGRQTKIRCNVVVGIYQSGPITAVPCRAKALPLPRASILFRPLRKSPCAEASGDEWWRRRVLPPGPQRLFHRAFIAIVGCPTIVNISIAGAGIQRGGGPGGLPDSPWIA